MAPRQLTPGIFRLLTWTALRDSGQVAPCLSLSPRCLVQSNSHRRLHKVRHFGTRHSIDQYMCCSCHSRPLRLGGVPLSHGVHLELETRPGPQCLPQRRGFFGLFRPEGRKQKSANSEPGTEILDEVERRMRRDRRPPEVHQIKLAMEQFLRSRLNLGFVEAARVDQLFLAYQYLQKEMNREDFNEWISEVGLVDMLCHVLGQVPPPGYSSEPHTALIRHLVKDIKQQERRRSRKDRKENLIPSSTSDAHLTNKQGDIEGETRGSEEKWSSLLVRAKITQIVVYALYGKCGEAQMIAEKRWPALLQTHLRFSPELRDLHRDSWKQILHGALSEGYDDEKLDQVVQNMVKQSIAFDDEMQQLVVVFFAKTRPDLAMARRWYEKLPFDDTTPSLMSKLAVLELCIINHEQSWGRDLLQDLLNTHRTNKLVRDLEYQWEALQGRGVDEIAGMFRTALQHDNEIPAPDMTSINGLITHATRNNDPYTAERYIAMAKDLGLQPDAATFMLQLDYRIKVKDLSGALTAFESLRSESTAQAEDDPVAIDQEIHCLNKLIAAFCDGDPPRVETIKTLIEQLAERKARLSPASIAGLISLHIRQDEFDDLRDLLNTDAKQCRADDSQIFASILQSAVTNAHFSNDKVWTLYQIYHQCYKSAADEGATVMMMALFERRQAREAVRIFTNARQADNLSHRPSDADYALCLQGIALCRYYVGLELVHNMMRLDTQTEPTTRLRNAFMIAYVECGQPSRALDFWERIQQSREGPTLESLQIAFKVFERAPLTDELARTVWRNLRRMDVEITPQLYAAYIGALAGNGQFDECVTLCESANQVGLEFNALMLGSFHNATFDARVQDVIKAWARESYPEVYEELSKCRLVDLSQELPHEYEEGGTYTQDNQVASLRRFRQGPVFDLSSL